MQLYGSFTLLNAGIAHIQDYEKCHTPQIIFFNGFISFSWRKNFFIDTAIATRRQ
jgi:hypothetical protein